MFKSLNEGKQVTSSIESGGCITWMYGVPAAAPLGGKASGVS
jgi:hypothetical protein